MIFDLMKKKLDGKSLTQDDFNELIDYLMKRGEDNSIVKLLLTFNDFGMTKKEVLYFARAIRDSGRVLKFNDMIFEKHSTGGIGDASSLVLIPLLASLGYKVIKTTGRSLSYTNGSTDRFKAIPNFSFKLDNAEIEDMLNKCNACVLSHNGDICPADSILYGIREKYGLDSNINFIASSIAAKKMASGAKIVLIDVKYGAASIVKTYRDAKRLAKLLKYIFKENDIKSVIVITNTLQTFGEGIGNAIEVVDALNALQGKRTFLRRISNKFAVEMMTAVDKSLAKVDAYDIVNMAIDSGAAYRQFLNIVSSQGGDVSVLANATLFKPYHSVNFVAERSGYVGNIDSLILGELVRRLCSDNHDNNIGIALRVKIGDYVEVGDVVMSFYYKNDEDLAQYGNALKGAVRLTGHKIKRIRVVKKVIK